MKNFKKTEEKTCSKCNETNKIMKPQVFLGIFFLSLVVYALVDITKKVIELFSN